MVDKRITYSRRNPYRTKSNKTRTIKTPGSRHVAQYIKKKANSARCGVAGCVIPLAGVVARRPKEMKNTKKRQRTVSRTYGGNLCGPCLRDRIVRAFLIEEQKIVKKVLQEKLAGKK